MVSDVIECYIWSDVIEVTKQLWEVNDPRTAGRSPSGVPTQVLTGPDGECCGLVGHIVSVATAQLPCNYTTTQFCPNSVNEDK